MKEYRDRADYNRKYGQERRASGKAKEYKELVKAKVLTHYGNGKLACVRCEFSDVRALSLDHINGDGWSEKYGGFALYVHLRATNFPAGYQTLCMNCQYIKREENREFNFM